MVLEFVKEQMDDLGVPYRFWEWAGEVPQTYFVGEFTEASVTSEDGHVEGEFTLSGFTRGTYADLDGMRDKIYRRFRNGERTFRDGRGLVVEYSHATTVDTDLEGVRRIDIYLSTFEWSE